MAQATKSNGNNVFINCPFDKQYKPIFNAIVFAIHDAGFVARCSLEVIDSGKTRLRTILSIISECKYGIHDISRTEIYRDYVNFVVEWLIEREAKAKATKKKR